ncbi:MAG: hypothetical protein J7K89_08625 [Candidatus Cloacimonetes bacterium]|nr:hypothetical protein [Candidatus Cloacimonadota bacterium]
MLRKCLVLLSLALVVSVAALPVTVVDQSESQLILRFELPEYHLEKVIFDGNEFQQIICADADYSSEPGYPQMPFFSASLGLPVDGDFRVTVQDVHTKDVSCGTIVPVSRMVEDGDDISTVVVPDPAAYRSRQLYPGKRIRKGTAAFLGDRHFNSININPFQYNARDGVLTVTTEMTLRVNIIGVENASRGYADGSNFIDAIGDDFFLNNRFSSLWRKPREKATQTASTRETTITRFQLVVDTEGVYKITRQDLEDAADADTSGVLLGFDWDTVDPRKLELTDYRGTVPLYFPGESDGQFDADDYFEFFGDRHYGDNEYTDDYTAENVYVLTVTDHLGSRLAVENGGLEVTDPGLFTVPESYQQTLHFEEQNLIDQLGIQTTYNPYFYKEDIYFWDRISAPDLATYSFNLEYPEDVDRRKFSVDCSLWGATYSLWYPGGPINLNAIDHYAIVRVNASRVDIHQWNGQREQRFTSENELSNNYLNNGENLLYVSLPGLPDAPYEQVLLDYFDLTYWRQYKTDSDYLRFTKPQNKPVGLFQFELENFSSPDISVYKRGSGIMENIQIEPFFEPNGAPFKVTFQDTVISPNAEYIAVTEAQKKKPLRIMLDVPSQLHGAMNQADYVIITIPEFVQDAGTQALRDIWQQQGKAVEVVSVQDIFDEFNGGVRSAEAIKDFISYAYNNWAEPRLTHVLLLGDGITDERDDSPNRSYNLIPFHKIWADKRGAIASDNWFGCIVGTDMVPDVSIGRINVWKASQLEDIAAKTIQYIEEPNYEDLWHSNITFAAGGNPSEGTFFAKQSERVRKNNIPSSFNATRVYCNTDDLPASYAGNTTTLISTINDGSIYVQFMGHGGGYVWADYNLLNKADVQTMNNENLPVVASYSCFGSAFNYPQSSCIGEELTLAPGKGAIGHIGFTGFGYANWIDDFAKYITEGMFRYGVESIGEIVTYAKAKFYTSSSSYAVKNALINGCAYLGDPMIHMLIPTEERQVLLNDYTVQEGDTLIFKSPVGDGITKGKFRIYDDDDSPISANFYYPETIYAINDTISITNGNLYKNGYTMPNATSDIYTRRIKLFASGDDGEIVGETYVTVGKGNAANIAIIPEQPTVADSIQIEADIFDDEGVAAVACQVKVWSVYADPFNPEHTPSGIYTIPMTQVANNRYRLQQPISSGAQNYSSGYKLEIDFTITDDQQQVETTTFRRMILIEGIDLTLQNLNFVEQDNQPAIKVLVTNLGSESGSACMLKVYNQVGGHTLLAQKEIAPLGTFESRWETLIIPLLSGSVQFQALVNDSGESFPEINLYNNIVTGVHQEVNLVSAGLAASAFSSLDGNLDVQIPAAILPQDAVFSLQNIGMQTPVNQEAVSGIILADSSRSDAYQLKIYNEEMLADSTGLLPNNNRIELTFHYHPTDSLTQVGTDAYAVYRWEDDFDKWIFYGGEVYPDAKTVRFNTNRLGTFTILKNADEIPPYIDANVEGQEFTYGGYISRNGIISFLLSDANGIDMFNNKLHLALDGETVSAEEYSISLSQGNLTNIPIKYQLNNLDKGSHKISVDCTDCNGNYAVREIDFEVSTSFDIINVANYPNPVKSKTIKAVNAGRTRFTYVLTDDADDATIKVYTVSGRLVKTFKHIPSTIGYHEFPRTVSGWDCTDEEGFNLSNGVYFYKITAKRGSKKIEKIKKMAILK